MGRWWLLAGMLAWSSAWAVESVSVQALFSGRAVITVDGARHLLREGETTPEGVRLIHADSESALLEVDGVQRRLPLGSEVHTNLAGPKSPEVVIGKDEGGMFSTTGSINGQVVNFIADTGASMVSISGEQARSLGIDFRYVGTPIRVQTAGGVSAAYQVTLDRVRVGDIELRNVAAVVVPGGAPNPALLGMSFLGHTEIKNSGTLLMLRQKY